MDYSRQRQCDNSQGGNNKIYLFPFVEYSRSQITVSDNILTAFPYNVIYDLGGFNITFEEDCKEDKDVYYEQKTSFQLKKILSADNFKEYASRDYRVIAKDNNGNYRMLGLFTGVSGSFTKSTGGNRSDFNGYNFSFETKEENTAPFLTDLSMFNIMPIEGLLIENGFGKIIEDGNNNELIN